MNKCFAVPLIAFVSLALGGCFGESKDISGYMKQAQAYVAEGNAAKATVELQHALKIAPANPQANLALAKIEDARGDLNAAVPHYLYAADTEARLLEPQLRVAEILMDSGRLQEAAGRLNATLGAFPNNLDALALQADLLERQGQFEAARSSATAALSKNPTLPRALAVMAMLQLRQGNSDEAVATTQRGLKTDPDNLRLLQVQAAALLAANQPDKAVAALRSITKSAPRSVQAQTALANIEAESGHVDEATSTFKAAVSADPNNQAMQLAFIEFLQHHGPQTSVTDYLNQLISQNPSVGTYDLVLAEYDRSQGRFNDSIAVLQKASDRLKATSEGRLVQVALAKVLTSQGRNDKALPLLDGVLAAEPDNANALTVRALLETENGRSAAAVADALMVLRQNPVDSSAFQVLATAYLAQGEPKLAVDAMRRSTALSPADDDAQLRLAAFLQNGGDIQAARDVMARLTLRRSDSPEVWATDVRLALDRKDWGTATRSLGRYRALVGEGAQVNVLEGQLKAAQGQAGPAMQAFRSAMDADPTIDANVIGLYARAAVAAQQMNPAADYLQGRVATLKPDAANMAALSVMTLRGDAGSFDKAAMAYQQAVARSPRSIEPYSIYAAILLKQKRFDEARQVADAGLRAGVPAWSMAMLKGQIDETAGDLPAAAAAYKTALDQNPVSIAAANNYASLASDLEPRDETLLGELRRRFDGLESSTPPNLVDTIAWLDYRLGRFDEAKSMLTHIGAAQSDNPQIRFHLAAVLLASGDRKAGLALLDELKGATFPGSDEMRKLSDT